MENNNIKNQNQNQNHQEPIWLMMAAGILGALSISFGDLVANKEAATIFKIQSLFPGNNYTGLIV